MKQKRERTQQRGKKRGRGKKTRCPKETYTLKTGNFYWWLFAFESIRKTAKITERVGKRNFSLLQL